MGSTNLDYDYTLATYYSPKRLYWKTIIQAHLSRINNQKGE